MSDVSILEIEPAVIPQTNEVSHSPFSWSAAIAGSLAAMAISFLTIALGSGIGFSFASPYSSGPSAMSLTVIAAVWLVFAQTLGFATGGYLAGRLRSPAYDGVKGQTVFRDAAQGFIVWAIGSVIMASGVVLTSYFAASAAAHAVNNVASSTTMVRNVSNDATSSGSVTDYFVDVLLRPDPAAATAGGQRPPQSDTTVGVTSGPSALSTEVRAEVTRVLIRAIAQGKLDDNDRTYLAQVVSARTGMPPEQAESRVAEVEARARQAVKEAEDKSAKAGAFFSLWTFMALLFGGTAATLAGMVGGQLRDAEGRLAAAD
jgi:hypothetical protein